MDVGWVTAVLRLVADIGGASAAGGLVVALFLAPSSLDGRLTGSAADTLRTTGRAAAVWTVGLALLAALGPTSWTGPVAAVCAGLVAVGGLTVRRWSSVALLLVPAGVAVLLPLSAAPGVTGPRGDLVGAVLIWMTASSAVWAGALAFVLLAVRRGHQDVALRRLGILARTCWAVLVVAGGVFAVVRGGAVVPSLAVAAGAVAVLGSLVVAVRRRTARLTGGAPADPILRRLLGAQAVLLLVLVVAVGRVAMLPAPPPGGPLEAVTGYLLPGPPTWEHLLTTWRPDLVLGPVAVLAAIAYVAGVRHLRRAGRAWPAGRTACWLTGCGLVLVATSSGLGAYAPAVFSIHMALHMVLNMLAPLALVLGAPVTLVLRSLPPADPGDPPGPHEWMLALVGSAPARVLAQPIVAAALFAGSYYLLYLTGLFGAVIEETWSRTVLNAVILVLGYQFCWMAVGTDAAPRRLPHLGRLGIVFAVMPFHVVFAIILISLPTAVAADFYVVLDLAWSPDLLADQRLAGIVSLVLGEIVLIATQVVLLVQWHRHDQFSAFRAEPMDEDAAAYRDLLATLHENRRVARTQVDPADQDR